MSNVNRFKFADDGPWGAVVIGNIIMRNRDEAEAHIAAGGAVEESAKKIWYSLMKHLEMCTSYAHLCKQIQSNSDWNGTIGRYGYGFRT